MQKNHYKYLNALALGIIVFLVLGAAVQANTSRLTLENGMEVIFKENHSSPMISSLVFIRAGAKYEDEFNNGVTHLLEHLLFDGTKNRSREEISKGVENYGGYINAFTRKDLTAFMVLMPKEYIEMGLEIQADQLFNSIFPDEELPKERKVVIEEIQQGNDRESEEAYQFFNAKSMAGTAYERTVLGYKNIIASLPKEKIIEYWKQFYAPNNMIALVIGDFETDKMIEQFRSVFGVIPPVDLPNPPEVSYFPPTEKRVFAKAGPTKQTYINIGIDAPHFTDPDYYAFDLLAEYLSDDANSPLAQQLVDAEGSPLYSSFSASIETQEEFSRLTIDIITNDEGKSDQIIAAVEDVLENLNEYLPPTEILDGIKVSKKANEIFMQEKLHYYGFIIAPLMVTTGYDFLESYLEAIDKVNPSIISRAADRWLSDLKYIATVYHPAEESEAEEAAASKTVYRKETLENGLTLIVKSNPDSRVFALNVIGKNRSASEPPGKEGITDFVNRMIKKGTTSLNAENLGSRLASIGANVTLNDNPWIPYDDRYTTRQFSFMKFETIDEFTLDGLILFSDMIRNPSFDTTEVEKVRGQLMGVIGQESGSTLNSCRNLFYATLFEKEAFAKTINGSSGTIGSITREDLIAYHRHFYSAGNMIITIGTNFDADSMMITAKEVFGDMPAVDFAAMPVKAGTSVAGAKTAHIDMDKEQVYIFLGGLLPGAGHEDAPAIRLAATILSDRLGANLREKQGLAYSVGAGASFDKEFGWYTCTIGTGPENFKIARDGILTEINKLRDEGATSEEIEVAKNSLWGSTLTRQLSRINQLYYMGINEYLELGYDYYDKYVSELRAVTAEQIKAAAQKYFDTQNYVMTTVGKI
ncbi:MAG: pitrilysin family protein [Candidatus Zixiibacteriota bacterium]